MNFGELREAVHAGRYDLLAQAQVEDWSQAINLKHHLKDVWFRWIAAATLLRKPVIITLEGIALNYAEDFCFDDRHELDSLFWFFMCDLIEMEMIRNDYRLKESWEAVETTRAYETGTVDLVALLEAHENAQLVVEEPGAAHLGGAAVEVSGCGSGCCHTLGHVTDALICQYPPNHFSALLDCYNQWLRCYLLQWVRQGSWWR